MMRSQSRKAKARAAETRDFRRDLIQSVGRCELCGHDPARFGPGTISWRLACHEIARGNSRQDALDKPYAILVVCYVCHHERIHGVEDWPQARQLAALKRSRPRDYDLAAFNELVGRGPNRITEKDVEQWDD